MLFRSKKASSGTRDLSIISRGYNTEFDQSSIKKVQRFKEVNLIGPLPGNSGLDVMISMDISGSMDGSRSGPPQPCNSSATDIDCAIEAVTSFSNALFDLNESEVKIGFSAFARGLRCRDVGSSDGNCGDERLDIPMTTDRGVFDDFFRNKSNLADGPAGSAKNNYRGMYNQGSNYHATTVFSRAELVGKRVIPKSEQDPLDFPVFGDLGSGSRDRPDEDYPDVYVLIGDFFANATFIFMLLSNALNCSNRFSISFLD